MRKSSGEPKSIEADIESSNSEQHEEEQTEDQEVPKADEPGKDPATNLEGVQSDDWWSASAQTADAM